MVTRSKGVFAAALLVAALTGCPDEVGRNLNDDATGLLAPTDLAGAPDGGSKIRLTWKDNATSETGYRLEVSLEPFYLHPGGPILASILLPRDTTAFVYSSRPHTMYQFRVFAVTETLESQPSVEVGILSPYALDQPVILGIWGADSHAFFMTYSIVPGVAYNVAELSEDQGKTWFRYSTVFPYPYDTVMVLGLTSGTTYLVRVVAVGPEGESAPSLTGSITTLP